MKSQTLDFFLDFIQDNVALGELFEIVAQHNDETNLSTIQQLIDIRRINANTHTELMEESVQQLGINIARDIFSYRAEAFKKIFDALPEYTKVSGTKNWSKFVAMLIGGSFNSSRLYTNDYQTFVPTPLGTLIKDGGTWYKTTHVDLEVDIKLIDQLDLTITREAREAIITALVAQGMEVTEAENWHTNHIGLDPVNNDAYQRTARNVMFFQRCSQLFYQWAPIEEVLRKVYTTIDIASGIYIGAHTVVEPIRRSTVGKPLISELQFIQPDFIHGGTEVAFGVNILFSDNSVLTEEVYVKDHPDIESRNGNKVIFREPPAITSIDLTLVYGDTEHVITVRMFPLGIEPDPTSIVFKKKELFGNSSTIIQVYGVYANGQQRDLTASGNLILETPLGTFNGTHLVLPYVIADTKIFLKAKYQGIFDYTVQTEFDVRKSEMDLVPASLSLSLNDTYEQGQEINLRATVTYNENTSAIVDPQYISTSEHTQLVEDSLRSAVMRTDYLTSVVAQYTENGVTVSTSKTIKFLAPKTVLANIDIVMPNVITEGDEVKPKAIALYVTENATHQQIIDRDPSIIVAELEVEAYWTSSADPSTDVRNLPSISSINGSFSAPYVTDGYDSFNINAGVLDGSTMKSFSKLFDIYGSKYVPRMLSLLSSGKLNSGNYANLPVSCKWNTGKSASAFAQISVEFIPSPSSKTEAFNRTVLLQEEAIKNGQDPTQFDPNNPDYSRWVTLTISDSTVNMYDPFLAVQEKVKQLYFKGDLHGTAKVTMTYEYDGTEISSFREVVLVPVRALVRSIEIECNTILFEKSRTFARLFATYEDGTQEYVQAANWSAEWPEKDDDEYDVIEFNPSTYSGMSIVEILEGRTPTTFADFSTMETSKLPIFRNVGTLAELNTTTYDGAIVQVNKLNTDSMAKIQARFFRIEHELEVQLRIPLPKSINNITNARIDGSTNIRADVVGEPYSLVCTFEMPGIVRNMDGSYGTVAKTSYDAEMTCDWAITNHYTLDIQGDQRTLIPSETPVATMDNEGNVSPSQNADTAVRIRARYQCDGYSIERFLIVYILRANSYLLSMGITGQEIVWDVSERNSTINYDNGIWYVPYSYRVVLNNAEEINGNLASWRIGADTDVEGVSIDSTAGYLFLSSQISDGNIRIDCDFNTINPETTLDETISTSRVIEFRSTRSIISAEIAEILPNIIPNSSYQLEMEYIRRNDQIGSNLSPDADTVSFSWSIVEGSPGFTIDNNGVFRFAPAEDIQVVKVRCTLREQRTIFERDIEITCLKVGYPQELSLTGFSNVRDDSVFQLSALLGRTGTFDKENVNAKSLWQVTNDRGDTVTVQGVSVDQRGNVTIGALLSDIRFGIRVTYIEGTARLVQTHFIDAFSSYPYYGTAPFGVTSLPLALANLTNRLRSKVGGTFVFSPRTNEYGYFMCPSRYGTAAFAGASDSQGQVNLAWRGMDGARWPITGDDGRRGAISLQRIFDNVTDTLLLYRTDERAFGTAILTVQY